ncbi:MAG: hydantoinase/oxoprolinase family protein [Syntrophobacterales bacterium]|nr:hydantoinase/oxoprolinase family protein [Syntrophobacterales bacterium]
MIIGLDVGGTHTDVVLVGKEGLINQAKVPTEKTNLFDTIISGLQRVTQGIRVEVIERLVLSTTLTTNAILEGKGEPVGMIVAGGPGLNPELFRIGNHYYPVSGYIDHRGREVQPINPSEIETIASKLRADGIKSVGVVGKFSVRNPVHENQIIKKLSNGFDYVLAGHRVSGNLNFPRRIATVFLNASVQGIYKSFFLAIQKSIATMGIKAPIYVLKADGGTMSLEASMNFPGQTIFSGPAASIMGALSYANPRVETLVLDIGGTTTDMGILIDRVPLLEPLGIEIGGLRTLVRSLNTESIALGGDSVVRVKEGHIFIGPDREGPAMAFGGSVPTPTDALIVLGIMKEGDPLRAEKAMAFIGEALGCDPISAAREVYTAFCHMLLGAARAMVERINQRPVYTIREFLDAYRVEPQEIFIIGGPAPYFAPKLSEMSGLPTRVVPYHEVVNAIGAALSRTTCELTLFVDTERGIASAPEDGFYKPVGSNFSIDEARDLAVSLLVQKAQNEGASSENIETEVVEELQFNMVRGFYTTGKNIRVKVQVKPGLINGYRVELSKELSLGDVSNPMTVNPRRLE